MIICKVAILIPTKNRSEFLIRQLRYYASVNNPHPIYVGDASDEEHKERNQSAIEGLQSQIKIHYNHWPKLNNRQTNLRLAEMATEQYCAWTGDDDFLVPGSLNECAKFLKDHSDYRTAQGKGILFSLQNSGAYGELKDCGAYWARKEAVAESGSKRLLNFGANYWVPVFSVHRTVEFCNDMQDGNNIADLSFDRELTQGYLMICRGKSKFLDCLYLVREGHNQHFRLASDYFGWITGPNWQPSYQIFHDTLTDALSSVDNISESKASEIVKQAFWAHLSSGIKHKYKAKYFSNNSSFRGSIRKRLKMIPGAVHLVKNIRAKLYNDELSLPALLNSASPYHKDFMPVYEAIIKQPITQ